MSAVTFICLQPGKTFLTAFTAVSSQVIHGPDSLNEIRIPGDDEDWPGPNLSQMNLLAVAPSNRMMMFDLWINDS
jgi:hypothetical protein